MFECGYKNHLQPPMVQPLQGRVVLVPVEWVQELVQLVEVPGPEQAVRGLVQVVTGLEQAMSPEPMDLGDLS